MKTLLVAEYREGTLLESTYELFGFASQLGADTAMLLVGSEGQLPEYNGTVYLADAAACGEYNPDLHKKLVLEAMEGAAELDVALKAEAGFGKDWYAAHGG